MDRTQTMRAAIFDMDGTLIDSMSSWRRLNADYIRSQNIPLTAEQEAELFSLSGEQLCSFPGIGPGKACSLLSAMELGRRFIQESNPRDRKPITTSRAVYDLMIPQMKALAHEECWILLLNDASLLIDKVMLSLGGHRATVLDERIALKKALEKSASAMILVHNHPSSSPIPSKADIEITQKFRNACEACSIDLLDHVIICDDCFFSFADEKTFRP